MVVDTQRISVTSDCWRAAAGSCLIKWMTDAKNAGDDELALLTAQEAARLLRVDPKIFRQMGVTFILVGKTKRYTRPLLRQWQSERATRCPVQDPAGGVRRRSRASNTSSVAGGRRDRQIDTQIDGHRLRESSRTEAKEAAAALALKRRDELWREIKLGSARSSSSIWRRLSSGTTRRCRRAPSTGSATSDTRCGSCWRRWAIGRCCRH